MMVPPLPKLDMKVFDLRRRDLSLLVEVGYTAKKWGHILRFGYAKHIWCVLT